MFGIYGGSYGESQIIRNIDKYELLKCHQASKHLRKTNNYFYWQTSGIGKLLLELRTVGRILILLIELCDMTYECPHNYQTVAQHIHALSMFDAESNLHRRHYETKNRRINQKNMWEAHQSVPSNNIVCLCVFVASNTWLLIVFVSAGQSTIDIIIFYIAAPCRCSDSDSLEKCQSQIWWKHISHLPSPRVNGWKVK